MKKFLYKNVFAVSLLVSCLAVSACGIDLNFGNSKDEGALFLAESVSASENINDSSKIENPLIGDWIQEDFDNFNTKYHFEEDFTGTSYYAGQTANFSYTYTKGYGSISFFSGENLNYYIEGEKLVIEDDLMDNLEGGLVFKKLKN